MVYVILPLFQMIRDAAFKTMIAGRDEIGMEDVVIAYKKLKSEYERLIRSEEWYITALVLLPNLQCVICYRKGVSNNKYSKVP